jgi:zinc/manganese transport system substrate-binding protein
MVLSLIRPLVAVPAVALALALAAAGCGEEERAAAGRDGPTVVATTGFAADLVSAVAGEGAEVVQLVPDAADPHSYGASAKDRAQLDAADLVVAFGSGYEEALPLEGLSAERLDLTEHAGALREPGAEHPHDDDGAHEAGAADPHVWMDPTRMARAAAAVGAALAAVDPEGAPGYGDRAEAEAARLRDLDREVRDVLAAIPPERRRLVASHESLGYFADRYDLEFVDAPFGLAPEAQASGQDVAAVVAAVREQDVPAVFAQQGDDPKVMRQIATEAGVAVVEDLYVENPGPDAPTYADAMRHNAARIAGALAP